MKTLTMIAVVLGYFSLGCVVALAVAMLNDVVTRWFARLREMHRDRKERQAMIEEVIWDSQHV